MKLHRSGIKFKYKGDEVIWIWPWKREFFSKPYFSVSFMGYFSSLKELDEFWEEYSESQKDLEGFKE